MSKVKSVTLLILWTIASLAGLFYVSANKISEFDPALSLSMASMNMRFDNQFTNLIENGLTQTVVHFTGNDCVCESLTQRHADQLASVLSADSYNTMKVDVSERSELARYVPSTPAVAVIDEDGALRYFGPYASGLGCITNVTFVDKIAQIATSVNYHGAVINHQLEGCFCHTEQQKKA